MSSVFGSQILGRRENQEDGFRIELQNDADPDCDVLMVLADGMGGHAAGEVASRVALDAFLAHFLADTATPLPLDRLDASLRKANEAIAAQVARSPELAGMGCTLIGCLKLSDGLVWVSVGDSLLLRLRAGRLERLNADHSVYGELIELVRHGRLSVEEADRHPQRHALRSAVMGSDMPLVDLGQADFAAGDIVLLASDGIETLDDERIARLVEEARDDGPSEICQRLLAAVEGMGRPNQDNTTVIALRSPTVVRQDQPAPAAPPRGARDGLDRVKRLALDRPIIAAVGGLVVVLLVLAILWPTGEPAATPVRQTVTERPVAPPEPKAAVVPPDNRAVVPKARPEGEAASDEAAKPGQDAAGKDEAKAEASGPPANAAAPKGEADADAAVAPAEPSAKEGEPAPQGRASPGGQAAPKDGTGSDVPASRPVPEH